MSIEPEKKKELIEAYKRGEKDTGKCGRSDRASHGTDY